MTLKKAFKAVLDYFEGDYEKTLMWWIHPNPTLGEAPPIWFIAQDKTETVCEFIEICIKGQKS